MYSLKVQNEKLMDAIISLSRRSRFYFEMLTYCDFREIKSSDFFMGIYVRKRGNMELAYNPAYVDSWSEEQIHFILIHEIQHFLSNHQQRATLLGMDRRMSNIAADMIINSNIAEQTKLSCPSMMVEGKMKGVGCFLPSDYDGEKVVEPLYDWLQKNDQRFTQQTIHLKISNQEGKDVNVTIDGKGNIHIDKDAMDEANGVGNEVSDEMKDTIIKEMVERCQARGLLSGSEEAQLQAIRRAKKNYLHVIKTVLSEMMGAMKSSSWKTFSRKYDLAPGFHRVRHEFNVVLDVSGSMSGLFERVLSYIFYHDITVNLIQCDTVVQAVKRCHLVSDIQKTKIKGLGGTTLQPALNFIAQDRTYHKFPTLVLTDGYCDTLNFDALSHTAMIITARTEVQVSGSKKVRQVVVKE